MPAPTTPIFILGILQRSGTNYLRDLLCIHPVCAAPGNIAEDHLLRYIDQVFTFAQQVSGRWTPTWGVNPTADDLCRHLGDGLAGFLSEQAPGSRVVTKTPSVECLAHFPRFFPSCKLLILVRDGRAVVESGVRSFGWSYEVGARNWAQAARVVLQFGNENRDRWPNYLIVNYERLVAEPRAELSRIMRFLELDPGVYDFERATALPVRGSSELRVSGETEIHWNPVARSENFNPLARWEHWSKPSLERFDWIAGEYLTAFGYESDSASNTRLGSDLRNRLLDLEWWLNQQRSKFNRRLARLMPTPCS